MRMLPGLLALSFVVSVPAGQATALQAGDHVLHVEYASTPLQRERGLMERTELAADGGMLFRFDEVRRHCLWMKDTPLPLSAAFMDEQGVIVDIIDLQPLSMRIRCSREPARYALEVNQGWFTERGIERGERIQGLPQP